MMRNQNVARGLALIVIALFFGVQAAGYEVGVLSKAGPGLFPLIVSVVVGIIGAVTIFQARFEAAIPLELSLKNVGIILASLVGFVLISKYVSMLPAIVFLVFVSGFAGTDYSISRSLKITAVLVAIAYAFYRFLGLQLVLI